MTYVRNTWYVAAWAVDVQADTPQSVTILGEPIVFWKSADGSVHALEDRCVHKLAALSLGRCEGKSIRCMYHGIRFGVDGRAVEIPGQTTIPEAAKVRCYPIVDRHGWIWIWLGDPEKADPELIPNAIGIDRREYIFGHGLLDYAAEASLINDNLCDFSHLTFVHSQSFGEAPHYAEEPASVSPLPNGIRVHKWIEAHEGDDPFDYCFYYDYVVPGILIMEGGRFPFGHANAVNRGVPDFADCIADREVSSQAVTPISKGKARYFFCSGTHVEHGNEKTRDALIETALAAFAEDKVMIEAQQRIIDMTPNPTIMPTIHDKGVTIFNRLVARLSKEN